MSVSSPYALFRATELAWPARDLLTELHQGPPLPAATPPVRRGRPRGTRPGWSTVIQGELFQLA